VVAATNRIFKELIPKLLEDPLKLAQTSSLTDMFHSYGINMRFIGAVLKRCLETPILAEALLRVVVEVRLFDDSPILYPPRLTFVNRFLLELSKLCYLDACVTLSQSQILMNPSIAVAEVSLRTYLLNCSPRPRKALRFGEALWLIS
jgi:hypothetical protein